ncbi:MAG: porphobilinogen synthase [Deltaproteobacteria bacterium]|nr:MAG: porphobilinogen synthase [Deltaproteobacteria bacterium]
MIFPEYRARRMRASAGIRKMVRETSLSPSDFILPIFVIEGKNVKNPIDSMPGHFQLSIDNAVKLALEAKNLSIPAIMVFGIPSKKDALGSSAYNKNGIVQKAVSEIKNKIPELVVITDVCLCQYTDHGHCGFIEKGKIDNDVTIDLLGKIAVSHSKSGADMVAPSDMMDGRIAEIRAALDENSMENTSIMSYAVKYCSAYYGPFRQAAHSAPKFGDRKTYQMDPANSDEALREATMDIEEGADIIMVKPALAYLDIIYRVREGTDLPLAAYNVSGEYAMIKAAAEKGWVDEKKITLETLLSIKRAGAKM